ncbi:MAG: acido-empty-quinoprotein group A [Granulicella sp.]
MAPGLALALTMALMAGQSAAQATRPAPRADSIAPVGDSWPTHNGDYSGRRFSALNKIDASNVRSLALAWAFPTHGVVIKSTPLEVNGILYFTTPDNVWAVDAQTGQQVWSRTRPSVGNHIGQRGVAYYKDRLYFGTPDAHLLCLEAKTGKQIWDVVIGDEKFGYYLSSAPLVVNGKVLIGTSGDQTNIPHYLEARDWETGALVWRTSSLPEPGAPGSETWPDAKSMSHGGGPMWLTGTYDETLHLLYWGTGNPHPVLDGNVRAGANLYTDCILALNPDTGKIVWYFNASPHDTHDWDAVETPVLFDGEFQGRRRKMLAQASRNGYFFVLDRKTGENLLTSQFVKSNWAKGVDAKGSPIPDPAKEPHVDGTLVQSATFGGTNWMSPSFNPQTGLFYVNAQSGYSYWHLMLDAQGGPEDHQGGAAIGLMARSSLVALDYRTGKVRWQRDLGDGRNGAGVLTTAGHVLFCGDVLGNLLGLDARDGSVLWHARTGANMNNGPMTYMVQGRQYVVMASGDMLYGWALPERRAER